MGGDWKKTKIFDIMGIGQNTLRKTIGTLRI